MGEGASGSPGGDAPNRHGWQLPDDTSGVPGPPAYDAGRYDEQRPLPPPPQGRPSAMPTTMPGSVAGLARAVNVASVQGGANGVQTTVVTFRLEQYDARAGRTGVVTVRLSGDSAIGFVADGDWVEVIGKTKRGFLTASRAVNHTSQAQYSAAGQGCAKIAAIIAFCLILLFILGIGVTILLSVLGAE
jgi:hypothetical protein